MSPCPDLGLMTAFDQWSVDGSKSVPVPNTGLKRPCCQFPAWVYPKL